MIPQCSMYGIFTYISPKCIANVGKYTIHGAYYILYVLPQSPKVLDQFFPISSFGITRSFKVERNTTKTILELETTMYKRLFQLDDSKSLHKDW